MLRRMLEAPILGKTKRRRGRQKTRWKDSCKRYIESIGLKEETQWAGQSGRMIFKTILATPNDGKARGEEEVIYLLVICTLDVLLKVFRF